MLRNIVFSAVFVAGSVAVVAQSAATTRPPMAADYGKLPLSFEINQGQSDSHVKFTSTGSGYTLFLTDSEAVLALSRKEGGQEKLVKTSGKSVLKTDVVRMQLVGAKPNLKVAGDERLPGTANYFIGNDPAKWHTSVPTYAKVKYTGVYPGVDLVYYGNQRQLEYDFVVAPGADPKEVKLHFAGAKISLNQAGDLIVAGQHGDISFHKPAVYQVKDGEQTADREVVDGSYTILAGNNVQFTLGDYDKSRALVIDPRLVYSTYLGGTGIYHYFGEGDGASGIAVDSSGNAYVTGSAYSLDFPTTTGAFQTENHGVALEGSNAFVTKLNSSGTALLYSTYLGGSKNLQNNLDSCYGIAVDGSGYAYVTGIAGSSDFPVTKGAFQTVNKGKASGTPNAFVTKLSQDGTALQYSTYLGGSSGVDYATSIAVDDLGHAYVTGVAYSKDFPVTAGAFQTVNKIAGYSGSNAFVTKLSPAGTDLRYSTYLGGSTGRGDFGNGIAVDAAGHAYVTGYSFSTDFPTTAGAFQTVNRAAKIQAENAFITKLNYDGTGLHYSTYLGGNGTRQIPTTSGDGGTSIAVDAVGHAYVTGFAFSTNFPTTPDAFQATNKAAGTQAENAFITKLNYDGTGLHYSTYLGGSSGDSADSIAVDALEHAYVTGFTSSTDFPVTEAAFQKLNKTGPPNAAAFVSELNPDGTAQEYSSYFGGSLSDTGAGIAVDASRNVYLAGSATSTDFPVTKGAFQTVNHGAAIGASNAFIAKFSF